MIVTLCTSFPLSLSLCPPSVCLCLSTRNSVEIVSFSSVALCNAFSHENRQIFNNHKKKEKVLHKIFSLFPQMTERVQCVHVESCFIFLSVFVGIFYDRCCDLICFDLSSGFALFALFVCLFELARMCLMTVQRHYSLNLSHSFIHRAIAFVALPPFVCIVLSHDVDVRQSANDVLMHMKLLW